jgi:putative transposase
VEIINHCVWLYYRFPLSLRDIEEMMAQRGVIVSYETIHQWCRKFGQSYANGLRRRRAPLGACGTPIDKKLSMPRRLRWW